jgi:hypothetical protein
VGSRDSSASASNNESDTSELAASIEEPMVSGDNGTYEDEPYDPDPTLSTSLKERDETPTFGEMKKQRDLERESRDK